MDSTVFVNSVLACCVLFTMIVVRGKVVLSVLDLIGPTSYIQLELSKSSMLCKCHPFCQGPIGQRAIQERVKQPQVNQFIFQNLYKFSRSKFGGYSHQQPQNRGIQYIEKPQRSSARSSPAAQLKKSFHTVIKLHHHFLFEQLNN